MLSTGRASGRLPASGTTHSGFPTGAASGRTPGRLFVGTMMSWRATCLPSHALCRCCCASPPRRCGYGATELVMTSCTTTGLTWMHFGGPGGSYLDIKSLRGACLATYTPLSDGVNWVDTPLGAIRWDRPNGWRHDTFVEDWPMALSYQTSFQTGATKRDLPLGPFHYAYVGTLQAASVKYWSLTGLSALLPLLWVNLLMKQSRPP